MFQVELPVEIDAEVYEWLVAKRGEAVSVADARGKMQAALTGFLHRTASRMAATIRAFGDEHDKMEKYSPDEPRVPAGSPDGGEWASGTGRLADLERAHDRVKNHRGREPNPTAAAVANYHSQLRSLHAGVVAHAKQQWSKLGSRDRSEINRHLQGASTQISLLERDKDETHADYALANLHRVIEILGKIKKAAGQFVGDIEKSGNNITVAFWPDEQMEKASYSVESMLANLLPIEWDSLIPDMARSLRAAAQAGGAHALVGLRVDDASMLSDVNRVAAEWADDRAAEMVGRKYVKGKLVDNPNAEWVISDYTRDQLKSIITDAFKAKTSMRDLADEVEQAGVFSESRAEMIARTEIARAENRGNLTGWKQSGLVELIDWQLSADHDDSSNCSCSDYAEAGPYELDDVPEFPAHPNCWCSLTVAQLVGQSYHEAEED